MTAMTHQARPHVGTWERTHVPRSRGAAGGTMLVLLGLWGGLVPFVGPLFGFAYTPSAPWTYTTGRLWLEVLPAAAVVLGGLFLLSSSNRIVGLLGGWLAALGGAWFVIGRTVSTLWTPSGLPAGGAPAGPRGLPMVLEEIAFFPGLGAVVVFVAAMALGRLTVISVRDLRPATPAPDEEYPAEEYANEAYANEGYAAEEGRVDDDRGTWHFRGE